MYLRDNSKKPQSNMEGLEGQAVFYFIYTSSVSRFEMRKYDNVAKVVGDGGEGGAYEGVVGFLLVFVQCNHRHMGIHFDEEVCERNDLSEVGGRHSVR